MEVSSSDPTPSETAPPAPRSGLGVLLLGFSESAAGEIVAAGEIGAQVLNAGDPDQAHRFLDRWEVAVFCLGPEVSGTFAQKVVRQVLERHSAYQGCNVVLAAGPELELFQDLVDLDQLYYVTQKPPPISDVVHILKSGISHYQVRQAPAADDDERAIARHRVLKLTEGLARESDLQLAVGRTVEAARELVEADRATVLLYDPESETLWARELGAKEERRESAAAGLVSFVVRTRTSVRLEKIGDDPRYDPEADNDEGPDDERFLAVPVSDPGAGGRVWAVVVALRNAARMPFSESEQDLLELLAEQSAPVMGRFLLQAEIEEKTSRRHGVGGSQVADLFREEALQHHLQGLENQGHVLQISPAWTAWTYRLLLILFVAAAFYTLIGSVSEWAAGPAVVRLEGRTDVTATLSGNVVSVEVSPGDRVEAGDVLVSLYGAQEAADLDRISREFELGLVNRLRNPADAVAALTLGALHGQKTVAEQRLKERSVRAPHAGTVGDVWIQPGKHLTPGQVVLSLDSEEPKRSIVALLPGHYRPLVKVGMQLRLELTGYSYAYQHLVVDAIGDDIVGPTEVQRFLGPGIGDTVNLNGPVVLVSARLPSATFESDGQTFEYHDGIQGTAEVRVRTEKILIALVPGLKAVWSRRNG